MSNGANSIHQKLRHDLEDYIKAQYFGKSPLLLSAVEQHLDDEGLLYQKPFIESSPAYKSVKNGIANTLAVKPDGLVGLTRLLVLRHGAAPPFPDV